MKNESKDDINCFYRPGFAATIIIELYEDAGAYSIKIKYNG